MQFISERYRQRAATVAWLLFTLTVTPARAINSDYSNCRHDDRYILGNHETVTRLDQHSVRLTSLIDSGSTISSMDAHDIDVKTHTNGSRWVYFNVPNTNENHDVMIKMVKPLVRYAWIQTHSGKPQKRPVIRATIQLGPLTLPTEFSLIRRSPFKERLLLGKNTLEGVALIDIGGENLLSKNCELVSR
ncbi:hypothetical protein GCM10023116_05850 [Kistimonas scapharcae]|uniref:Retropepsin-like aspartic endopeptidase domain-containing protein n=1 Tax=Kistimonas scapharcae TaxID=1036133 RepID=A0ABP8UWN3_9GAMM